MAFTVNPDGYFQNEYRQDSGGYNANVDCKLKKNVCKRLVIQPHPPSVLNIL